MRLRVELVYALLVFLISKTKSSPEANLTIMLNDRSNCQEM